MTTPKTARLTALGRQILDQAHMLAAQGRTREEILEAVGFTEGELQLMESMEKITLLKE